MRVARLHDDVSCLIHPLIPLFQTRSFRFRQMKHPQRDVKANRLYLLIICRQPINSQADMETKLLKKRHAQCDVMPYALCNCKIRLGGVMR
jgi:hypothetical protein